MTSAANNIQCLLLLLIFYFVALLNCATASKYYDRKEACKSQPSLVCVVQPTLGNNVTGNVTFTPTFAYDAKRGKSGYHVCMVKINANLVGIATGLHGFHVHTFGDIRDVSGASTGGHFTNSDGKDIPHGFPDDPQRHWGDFGNIVADDTGVVNFNHVDRLARIPAILGRAITIHAEADKGSGFQPSGASGSRIGFCVIGIANTIMFPTI